MHKIPKEYIVYWTSRVAENRSRNTETFKANQKTFNDYDSAAELVEKLHELRKKGGLYMGRIVYHVAPFGRYDDNYDNMHGKDLAWGAGYPVAQKVTKIICDLLPQ